MQVVRPVLIFFFVFFIAANIYTLKDGHNWGDDFSQYVLNARNIAQHRPYAAGIMLENPTVYPPGFPLLLAPFVKTFGLDLKLLKVLNIFFWYAGILVLYLILLRRGGSSLAMPGAVFLAASSYFFVYKQNILSDIPFFFFTCCALYFFERELFLFFLLAASAAVWTRSAGNVLFAAALFYFLFIRRDMRKAAAALVVCALNGLIVLSWTGYHPGFWTTLARTPAAYVAAVLDNFATVFGSLWYFFCPAQTVLSSVLFGAGNRLMPLAAPVLYGMMLWSFIRGWRNRNLSYLECFSFFYLSLLVVWSGFTMPPGAFTRFVLPLLPFVFISIWRPGSLARIAFLVLLVINVTNIMINWDFNDDAINRPQTKAMAAWLKENTRPEEHFMFWKPRALALLTARTGTAPWIWEGEKEAFARRIKALGISYVVVFQDDRGLIEQLGRAGQSHLVWQNSGYKIFKIVF